jgi:excisionase family DNA binding protein
LEARRRVNGSMGTDEEQLTLTVPEVATLLRISRGACYEAIRSGQIPCLRFGRRIVIPRAALQLLLAGEKKNINEKSPGRQSRG